MNTVHDRIKFKCKFCSNDYSGRQALNIHVTSKHFNVKKFKCHYCDKGLDTRAAMLRHIDFIHLGEKTKYECNKCEK